MPFVIAVALVAAAVGDPLVEAIANTGILGRGYADNNHLSVIPALVAGLSLVLIAVYRRCCELLCRSKHERDWVIDTARDISSRAPLGDLPAVLLLQFAALFVMESAEQLVFGGKLLGGTVWLGAPVLFSVCAHVAIGAMCTLLIAHGARATVKHFARIIAVTLDFILLALFRRTRGLFARRRSESICRAAQMLCVRRTGERAPPVLLCLS